MTVMVPQGLSNRLRIVSASTGRDRCSRTEANENVVEGFWGEDIRLLELHIGDSRRVRRPFGLRYRVRGDINRRESCVRTP
jgi:hypothetical protein